ncbi:hypothetical protein ES703_13461 [subsurface metagenome]
MGGRLRIFRTLLIPVLLLLAAACESPLRDRIEVLVDSYQAINSEKVVYVDVSSGDDENTGTRDHPKKSIQPAIDLLVGLGIEGEVHVAAGTYNISETLELKEGIALFGGYSGDWSSRTPRQSIIQASSGTSPAIEVGEGLSRSTVVDGFTIKAGLANSTMAIYCYRSSPTISNNKIHGGYAEIAVGIFNISSSPLIRDNDIDGGNDSDESIGIYSTDSSSPEVKNNSIDGGTSSWSYAVYSRSGGSVLEGNTLSANGTDRDCGFYEALSLAHPQQLVNNDFFSCNRICVYPEGFYEWNQVTEMQERLIMFGAEASNNSATAP